MRASDAAAVAGLARALADFHGDASSVTERHFREHCLGPKKMGAVLIALSGKRRVGFVLTYDWRNALRDVRVRHIDLMFVREDFRKQGVGAALMRATAQRAIDEGCGRLTVGALVSNDGANRFYRKLGFEPGNQTASQYGLGGEGLQALSMRVA